MIICRNKVSNKLEGVYAGFFEYYTSPLYLYYLEHSCVTDKYPDELTNEEYRMAKANRII